MKPGSWARLPSSELRAFGSSGFYCCSAIAGKNARGELCLSHVHGGAPGSSGQIIDVAAKLLDQFGPGDYYFMHPTYGYEEGVGNEARNKDQDAIRQKQYEDLSREFGLEPLPYTETSLFDGKKPFFTRYSLILIKDGLQVVETEEKKAPLSQSREKARYYELKDEILHDISF